MSLPCCSPSPVNAPSISKITWVLCGAVPPQNLVEGAIVDVSAPRDKLAALDDSLGVRPARDRRDGELLPLANDEDFDHRVGVPMLVRVMMARFTNAATFAPARNAQ